MLEFLLKGAVIGCAIAAPVGPIGVLCIRRTLAAGRASGLATGLGAATADAFYGMVAGFGLTAISDFLLGYRLWLQGIGGLFLLGLGIRTFFARPAGSGAAARAPSGLSSYLSSVVLTLTNPATILSFAAVFAGLGFGQGVAGYRDATALVAGVFLGSTAWWLILTAAVDRWLRRSETAQKFGTGALATAVVTGFSLGAASTYLRRINQTSGLLLAAFGIAALASVV